MKSNCTTIYGLSCFYQPLQPENGLCPYNDLHQNQINKADLNDIIQSKMFDEVILHFVIQWQILVAHFCPLVKDKVGKSVTSPQESDTVDPLVLKSIGDELFARGNLTDILLHFVAITLT